MPLEQALAENTAAVVALTLALSANTNAAGAVPVPQNNSTATEETPKPKGKAKAAAKDAPAETPAVPAGPDYEQVKAKILALSGMPDKGRDAVMAVLAQFNVVKAPDLKPEQYAAVIEAVDAAMQPAAAEDDFV